LPSLAQPVSCGVYRFSGTVIKAGGSGDEVVDGSAAALVWGQVVEQTG